MKIKALMLSEYRLFWFHNGEAGDMKSKLLALPLFAASSRVDAVHAGGIRYFAARGRRAPTRRGIWTEYSRIDGYYGRPRNHAQVDPPNRPIWCKT